MMTRAQLRAPARDPQTPAREDRRSFRRVNAPLKARFMLSDGEEYPARVRSVSAADTVLQARAPLSVGQELVLYIDLLGRLKGEVTQVRHDEVHVTFDKRRARMARTADTLIWLVNSKQKSTPRRRAMRVHQNRQTSAVTDDGMTLDCRILDISVTGASLSLSPKPAIGTVLTIGKMRGRVVRYHDSGVGIEFIKA